MKAFISWSGGKDASLSLFKAVKEYSLDAKYLLNMISEDGVKSRTHGIKSELLVAQSQAMDIQIIQRPAAWDSYEKEFIAVAKTLKDEGITHGVFGDIDLQEHRDWVERVCKIIGIEPVFPIWLGDRQKLIEEFIGAGFVSHIVSVRSDLMEAEWLGRKIDSSFISDLKKYPEIDLCGEKGEFHSFVVDGPVFNKKIVINKSEITSRENHHFWEINDYEIISK